MATLLALTGMRQRTLGEGLRLLQAAGQQLRLSRGRLQSTCSEIISFVMVCFIACMSSGTASATRPARVYAAPKAAAIPGK